MRKAKRVKSNLIGPFNFYDEATGQGAMTELYLQDRASNDNTWAVAA